MMPDEKARLMESLLCSPYWEIVRERLDEEIKYLNLDISLAIKKQKYDTASHLNGKLEMAEFIKALPERIVRENRSIIERVKEALSGS